MQRISCAAFSALLLATLTPFAVAQASKPLPKQPFGKTSDGREVYLYTLKNSSGMEVRITNYGGTIEMIRVKDRRGKFDDVVLGFSNLDGYTAKINTAYFGALIGRYGNRIAGGTFKLDGHTYHIPTNDTPRPNSLHGGNTGFNKRVWRAKDVSTTDGPALELHYLSPDGEEGFPGNLDVTVRYSLDSNNGLHIDYFAKTDKDTVLNLTNHSYFNLRGAGSATVLTHKLMLDADRFTPTNANLIPTGKLVSVSGTPFDFRKSTDVGARIGNNSEQLKLAKGYDHNFVLNHPGDLSHLAARVEEPNSGRVLEVYTTQPGIQFYSGNFLEGKNRGIGGVYRHRSALCLETQHFPDSPNHPSFPSTVLHPGDQFHETTIYRFSTH
ncbi:MAG TPA: aldose epimerase family protein [Bryobacteraceae bacterium]|nr:aldose epimerase family protein [Bryobacteraceae bacterium]